jgi:hypothetical protein
LESPRLEEFLALKTIFGERDCLDFWHPSDIMDCKILRRHKTLKDAIIPFIKALASTRK